MLHFNPAERPYHVELRAARVCPINMGALLLIS